MDISREFKCSMQKIRRRGHGWQMSMAAVPFSYTPHRPRRHKGLTLFQVACWHLRMRGNIHFCDLQQFTLLTLRTEKILTQSWKTLGTWRCPQHKLDQQSPSGESLELQVQDNMKQPCAMLCSAKQCYAMLVRCQTVKVSHCLMAVRAFVTRLCAWMIW